MNDDSVTHWIEQVKAGDEGVAQQALWDRYFSRLVALARRKLSDLPESVRDDEDLALSALNTFFMRARGGNFPQLHDRTDLWRLLATITARKSVDRWRTAKAQKRDFGHLRYESVFDQDPIEFAVVVNEPTPDVLAAINEECQRLMSELGSQLRPVAQMKLEGYTNAEIAEKLGRVERTVERKLGVIRQAWSKGLEVR